MTSGKRLALAVGIGLLTVFGSLSAAQAQYAASGPTTARRRRCRAASTAAASSLGFGRWWRRHHRRPVRQLRRRRRMVEATSAAWSTRASRVMGDVCGRSARPTARRGTTVPRHLRVALQFWVADILWLKGGIGGGSICSSRIDIESAPSTDESGSR